MDFKDEVAINCTTANGGQIRGQRRKIFQKWYVAFSEVIGHSY